MDAKYLSIKRLYDAGRLSLAGVANAVTLGFITPEQYEEITGQAYAG